MVSPQTPAYCPECGAVWQESNTCQEYFHQMLFWEAEYPQYGAEVHHLMVLCYHLQHPILYSPEGLRTGIQLLVDFLINGLSPAEVRKRNSKQVDSGNRSWKITSRPGVSGVYQHPIWWTMTAADITADSAEHYCDNVRKWAQSVYEDIKASNNLVTE